MYRLACVLVAIIAGVASAAELPELPPQHCPVRPTSHSSRARSHLLTESGAIIQSGHVRLGVLPEGNLGADWGSAGTEAMSPPSGLLGVGVSYLDQLAWTDSFHANGFAYDATYPGCVCEGWGASAKFEDLGSAVEGSSDRSAGGVINVHDSVLSNSDNQTATTNGTVNGNDPDHQLQVVHKFRPSPFAPKLYEVNVTLINTGSKNITELKYSRVMDWDLPPTEFSDCVDINVGTSTTVGDVECVHDNGFVTPTPSTFITDGYLIHRGRCYADADQLPLDDSTNIEHSGPLDHGSAWLFNFQSVVSEANPLPPGGSHSFLIFYGAADNDDEANAQLAGAGIEAYSYGYANEGSQCLRTGVRYIFGFGKIGGDPIIPSCGDGNCLSHVAPRTSSSVSLTANPGQSCISLSFA